MESKKMENDWKERFRTIMEGVALLPEKERRAFWWAMDNFDELRHICEISRVTPEELEEYYTRAWKKEDYALVALLALYEFLHREDGETENGEERESGGENGEQGGL